MSSTTVPKQRLDVALQKRRQAEQAVAERDAELHELRRRLEAAVVMIRNLRQRLDEAERELRDRRNAPQFGSLRPSPLGRPA